MSGSLDGIRVLDVTHVLAGPTAGMLLGDLGAEVLHIEPPTGDDARTYGPFCGAVDGDHSAYFISLNRNKKSVVLNLTTERGKTLLEDLVRLSDVLIENYRPGALDRLGFGWDDVRRMNPRLVYASISGFGHDALPAYAERPAYDMVAQAYSGLMSITGPDGGEPCRVGSSVGDIVAGHQAVIGILAALMHRQRTGLGQRYDGSLVDGLLSILENAVVRYTVEGQVPGPLGTAHPSITPFQAFPTADGWIVTPIGSPRLWERFCAILGRPELLTDPRFVDNPTRTAHRRELAEMLAATLRERTTADWLEVFGREGVPCSPVNTLKEVCEDPQIRYRDMLVDVKQPGVGTVRIAGSPLRLSETPGAVRAPAPRLGEHTDEVLGGLLGLSPEELQELRDDGVIG